MASTYVLINSNTLTASAATVTFSSIPSTYTDLVIRVSTRTSGNGGTTGTFLTVQFNSTTSGYSYTALTVDGAGVTSSRNTAQSYLNSPYSSAANSSTANGFSNTEIYISKYNSSSTIPVSAFGVVDNNNATPLMSVSAQRVPITAAVTSLIFGPGSGTAFAIGSSFYLYGIKNS